MSVLSEKLRQFAVECLNRYAMNREAATVILHTEDAYEDIIKLCDENASLQSQLAAEQAKRSDGLATVVDIAAMQDGLIASWMRKLEETRSAYEAELAAERAKRGELIERAAEIAEEESHRVDGLSPFQFGAFIRLIIAKAIRALDPEATQAFDAMREREKRVRELIERWHGPNGGNFGWINRMHADELKAMLAETEGSMGSEETLAPDCMYPEEKLRKQVADLQAQLARANETPDAKVAAAIEAIADEVHENLMYEEGSDFDLPKRIREKFLTPDASRALAEQIRKARLDELSNYGHGFWHDEPVPSCKTCIRIAELSREP